MAGLDIVTVSQIMMWHLWIAYYLLIGRVVRRNQLKNKRLFIKPCPRYDIKRSINFTKITAHWIV